MRREYDIKERICNLLKDKTSQECEKWPKFDVSFPVVDYTKFPYTFKFAGNEDHESVWGNDIDLVLSATKKLTFDSFELELVSCKNVCPVKPGDTVELVFELHLIDTPEPVEEKEDTKSIVTEKEVVTEKEDTFDKVDILNADELPAGLELNEIKETFAPKKKKRNKKL
jgi:hypothetical protein